MATRCRFVSRDTVTGNNAADSYVTKFQLHGVPSGPGEQSENVFARIAVGDGAHDGVPAFGGGVCALLSGVAPLP